MVSALNWKKATGSLATGETADAAFTFRRVGFLPRRITVHSFIPGAEIATLRRTSREKSLLKLADGHTFEWKLTKTRGGEMAFFDTAGLIMSFRPVSLPAAYHASVEITPGKLDPPGLALLALLGWYQIVLEYEDADNALWAMALARSAVR